MLRLFRSSPPPRADGLTSIDVVHDGERYTVAIKRVARARRFTLRVRAATLDAVLTMPPTGSLRSARTFAERHAAWIGDRLRRLPQKVRFEGGATIPLRGIETPIVARPSLRAKAWLEPAPSPDGEGPVIVVSGTPAEQHRRVLDLLRLEARRDVEAAVRRHAAVVDRPVARITLRDTRSRWGSCTARGGLNFSWRLIMAPPFVLDYLAAHEVAHRVHMDHSDKFWGVCARLTPDLARAEAWLKSHGPSLHRFG